MFPKWTIKTNKYVSKVNNKDTCIAWKVSNSEFFWSVFYRIRTEYGPEKLRIRTLFTQWNTTLFTQWNASINESLFMISTSLFSLPPILAEEIFEYVRKYVDGIWQNLQNLSPYWPGPPIVFSFLRIIIKQVKSSS